VGPTVNIQVIIPVYHPDDKLIKLIDRLGKQTQKPSGITLVWSRNPGERDRVVEKVKSTYSDVRIMEIDADSFDHGGTRRRAVRNTACDIFIMMTQDAVPANNSLVENITAPLIRQAENEEPESPVIACVYARQLPAGNSSAYEKLSRLHNYSNLSRTKTKNDIKGMGIKAFFCSDVCCAYRRDIYEKAGGFVRHAVFNEDMVIARKFLEMGYGVRYEAGAKVIHSHDYTARQQLSRNFDLGASQAMFPEVFGDISSESEGMKFACRSVALLMRKKKPELIPGFCIQCGFKLLGYRLGKKYAKLPKCFIMKLTSNKRYWAQMKEG